MALPRILILCGSRFGFEVMRELAFGEMLAGVVVPQGREEIIETIEHQLAGMNIPVMQVSKENYVAELEAAIRREAVSMGLVASFPYRLPAQVYRLPVQGFYNLHPGPLPQYRGPDPVFWQIRNREAFAGVSLHQVTEGLDTGPVVLTEKIRLDRDATHGQLTTRLAQLAARMTGVLVRLAAMDLSIPVRQQEEAEAVYYPRQTAKDICINWQQQEASQVVALVNACNPWNKGAVTKLDGKILRILEAVSVRTVNQEENAHARPGQILRLDSSGLLVACKGADSLLVTLISNEEGYYSPYRCREKGLAPGNCFEEI